MQIEAAGPGVVVAQRYVDEHQQRITPRRKQRDPGEVKRRHGRGGEHDGQQEHRDERIERAARDINQCAQAGDIRDRLGQVLALVRVCEPPTRQRERGERGEDQDHRRPWHRDPEYAVHDQQREALPADHDQTDQQQVAQCPVHGGASLSGSSGYDSLIPAGC